MKILIYISGIAGGLLLLFRLLGFFMEFRENDAILSLGLVLLLLVCFPLLLIKKVKQDKKIKDIIKAHEGREKESFAMDKENTRTKGWSMNDSPFRERKSGLTWGGGNIKASNATRSGRRKFLK